MHRAQRLGSLLSVWAACGLAQAVHGQGCGPIPDPAFTPHPGVRELSGRLLVRPIQAERWIAAGRDLGEAIESVRRARARVASLEIGCVDAPDIHVLALPAGQTEASLAAALMACGDYEFAEPDWVLYPCDTVPDDPSYSACWHLQKIQAFGAWDRTTGDGSITCAFVDTGVDLTHPDLTPNLVPGFNAVTHLTQAQGGLVGDVNGHGTNVAGAAAAAGNNAQGGSGVGWDLKIMPIRASNWSSGSAFLSDLLYGASWAAFSGARIVSISYAGADSASAEATGAAIKDQYGGLLFWAAGNSNQELTFDAPSVVVVGSTDINDARAWDSNWGSAVDLVAPGVGIFTTARGGGYASVSGTSFSAPIAAATAALGWSLNPDLNADQIMTRLFQSCNDLGDPGVDPQFGHGRVNAYRMIELSDPFTQSENAGWTYPAVHPVGPAIYGGLMAAYYQLPHHLSPPWGFSNLPPTSWTVVATLTVPQPAPAPGFGADYTGYLWIAATGAYTFSVRATDGACLWIDGVSVVWLRDLPASAERSGTINLATGWHRLHCGLYSQTGTPSLSVLMRGGGMGDAPIAPQLLVHTTNNDAQAR